MIFFDTETTGIIRNAALSLDKQPYIIEIGMVRDPCPSKRASHFSTLIKPPIPLPEIITKITGLTDEDLEGKSPFDKIYSDLCQFVVDEDIWVAHNVPFDNGMLNFEMRRMDAAETFLWPVKWIDTVIMAQPFYNGRFMKLQALYEDLIGPCEQTHRALDDAKMLRDVYYKLLAKGG